MIQDAIFHAKCILDELEECFDSEMKPAVLLDEDETKELVMEDSLGDYNVIGTPHIVRYFREITDWLEAKFAEGLDQ